MSRKDRKKLEKELAFKKQLAGMEASEEADGIGGQFTVCIFSCGKVHLFCFIRTVSLRFAQKLRTI